MSDEILCPRCNSNQITANKKGFSGKKAVAGAVLTGGIGLLAGTIGSNKIVITCLSCGHQFKPGQKEKAKKQYSKGSYQAMKVVMIICLVIGILLAIFAITEKEWGFFAFSIFMCLFAALMVFAANKNIKAFRK